MISTSRTKPRKLTGFTPAMFALLIFANVARAQSVDPAAPTPLTSNSADGRVEPLDIGDSRLTRHHYIFSAGPGDLIINVESANLNGDVDLFAANGLRPLVKVNVFAGSFSGGADKISKSIFLRRREAIVLRVEGRAAGDEAARYRVSFEGPFIAAAPATGGEKPALSAAEAPRPGTRRVNSVGARIEEPTPPASAVTESPAAAAPARDEKAATAVETPSPPVAAPRPATAPAPRRTTAPRARVSRRRAPPAAETSNSSAPERVTTKPTAKPADPPPPPTTSSVAPPRPAVSTAKAPVPAAVGVRLVVELRDGERLERQMSEVRRVTVERGVLIVVGGDGRTERRPMSQVLKMAIE